MNDQSPVIEVSPQTFQTDVIDRSKQVPVLVLFWAEQVGPSVEARGVLERLVGRYQGKIVLALVDVADDQTLAQQLRVQGLPSIRVVRDGALVEQLEGPQPESALSGLLEQLTMSSGDMLRDQLSVLLERNDFDAALGMLQQAINEEPHNQAFRVELADVLLRQGNLDDGRKVLADIPEDTEDRDRPVSRLEIAEEAAKFADVASLQQLQADDPENLESAYQLAVVLAAAGEYPTALDHAMTILQTDREFRDDVGRTTMIRIFSLMGKGSEVAGAYRRRMFNFMH